MDRPDRATALIADRPDVDPTTAHRIGYQIVCLAEQNVIMQHLGFGAELGAAAGDAARHLIETTDDD